MSCVVSDFRFQISDFRVRQSAGRVTVSIENFDYNFVVPLLGVKVRLPRYQTTLTGESAGYTPPPL